MSSMWLSFGDTSGAEVRPLHGKLVLCRDKA